MTKKPNIYPGSASEWKALTQPQKNWWICKANGTLVTAQTLAWKIGSR